MTRFNADINNAGDGWIQVTISGPGVHDIDEPRIEKALARSPEPNHQQPVAGYLWRFRTDHPGRWREITLKLPNRHEVLYKPLYEQPEPLPDDEVRRLAMRYLEIGTNNLKNADFDSFLRKVVFGIEIATGPIAPDPYRAWYEEAQTTANANGFGPGTAADAIDYFAAGMAAAEAKVQSLTEAISKAYHTEDILAIRQILHDAIGDTFKAEEGNAIADVIST